MENRGQDGNDTLKRYPPLSTQDLHRNNKLQSRQQQGTKKSSVFVLRGSFSHPSKVVEDLWRRRNNIKINGSARFSHDLKSHVGLSQLCGQSVTLTSFLELVWFRFDRLKVALK